MNELKPNKVRSLEKEIHKEERPEEIIHRLYEGIQEKQSFAFSEVLPSYLEIGRILSEQKKTLDHGQFTEWVNDSEFPFSERQARKYMRVYKHSGLFLNRNSLNSVLLPDSVSTIDDLGKLISNKLNEGKEEKAVTEQYKPTLKDKTEIRKLEKLIEDTMTGINDAKKRINDAKRKIREIKRYGIK
jgi:hypothetical protein